jgi:hypothetical protein
MSKLLTVAPPTRSRRAARTAVERPLAQPISTTFLGRKSEIRAAMNDTSLPSMAPISGFHLRLNQSTKSGEIFMGDCTSMDLTFVRPAIATNRHPERVLPGFEEVLVHGRLLVHPNAQGFRLRQLPKRRATRLNKTAANPGLVTTAHYCVGRSISAFRLFSTPFAPCHEIAPPKPRKIGNFA